MENVNFVEKLADHLGQNASVRNVYGDPIETNGKTIIPVAQVGFGLGGGYGQNKRNKSSKSFENGDGGEGREAAGEGSGGGGGMFAKPKGVYEITAEGSRFIPSNNMKQLLMAGFAGFVIHKLFFRKKR